MVVIIQLNVIWKQAWHLDNTPRNRWICPNHTLLFGNIYRLRGCANVTCVINEGLVIIILTET